MIIDIRVGPFPPDDWETVAQILIAVMEATPDDGPIPVVALVVDDDEAG